MTVIAKPQLGMYKPFSGAYISLAEDNTQVSALETERANMNNFILSIPEQKLEYRYAEDKWTIKEMLVHLIDTERIFSYRALRMARNDSTPLLGFDQDIYVPYSYANSRSVTDILKEFDIVRMSTYILFAGLDNTAWDRYTLVDNHPVSVRAEFYLVIGHARHHLKVIKEKYL